MCPSQFWEKNVEPIRIDVPSRRRCDENGSSAPVRTYDLGPGCAVKLGCFNSDARLGVRVILQLTMRDDSHSDIYEV